MYICESGLNFPSSQGAIAIERIISLVIGKAFGPIGAVKIKERFLCANCCCVMTVMAMENVKVELHCTAQPVL